MIDLSRRIMRLLLRRSGKETSTYNINYVRSCARPARIYRSALYFQVLVVKWNIALSQFIVFWKAQESIGHFVVIGFSSRKNFWSLGGNFGLKNWFCRRQKWHVCGPKRPFLLVRFLLASKENEQRNVFQQKNVIMKTDGLLKSIFIFNQCWLFCEAVQEWFDFSRASFLFPRKQKTAWGRFFVLYFTIHIPSFQNVGYSFYKAAA